MQFTKVNHLRVVLLRMVIVETQIHALGTMLSTTNAQEDRTTSVVLAFLSRSQIVNHKEEAGISDTRVGVSRPRPV
jgi:hypothetical protein